MPAAASSAVPKRDQTIAAASNGSGIAPTMGKSVTLADSEASTGRKATSVISDQGCKVAKPNAARAKPVV